MKKETKVILMHGFSNEEVSHILNTYKTMPNRNAVIFAATTETSLEWKVKDLINELEKEHQEFQKLKEATK